MKFEETVVSFRSVVEDDFVQLKSLHELLFPVRYSDSFYKDVCSSSQGYTLHFNTRDGKIDWNESRRHGSSNLSRGRFFRYGFLDRNMFSCIATTPAFGNNLAVKSGHESYEIVGFILAQITSVENCPDRDLIQRPFFYFLEEDERYVCYILTLGTKPEYRRSGLGSKLVNICVNCCKEASICSAVYLHVIHYNESAIKFYQKNNFERLRTLLDFYKIDGSYHTAFLYILYLHGQKPPVFGRLLASMSSTALGSALRWFTENVAKLLPSSLIGTRRVIPKQLQNNDIDSGDKQYNAEENNIDKTLLVNIDPKICY